MPATNLWHWWWYYYIAYSVLHGWGISKKLGKKRQLSTVFFSGDLDLMTSSSVTTPDVWYSPISPRAFPSCCSFFISRKYSSDLGNGILFFRSSTCKLFVKLFLIWSRYEALKVSFVIFLKSSVICSFPNLQATPYGHFPKTSKFTHFSPRSGGRLSITACISWEKLQLSPNWHVPHSRNLRHILSIPLGYRFLGRFLFIPLSRFFLGGPSLWASTLLDPSVVPSKAFVSAISFSFRNGTYGKRYLQLSNVSIGNCSFKLRSHVIGRKVSYRKPLTINPPEYKPPCMSATCISPLY